VGVSKGKHTGTKGKDMKLKLEFPETLGEEIFCAMTLLIVLPCVQMK